MSTAAVGGSYKPLTGPYASTSAELVLSLIPESSSLSSTTPPDVNVTAHLRAALRAAQANLNAECAKTASAKLGLEKTDAEFARLQLEKRTLTRVVGELQVEGGAPTETLPDAEAFEAYCQTRSDPLPEAGDPYYEQGMKKARLEFELQEITERESQYASLQARLQELQQESSLLKKKAILADSSLSELQQALAKAKDAFVAVRLPSPVAEKGDEDVEMDSVSEDDAEHEAPGASPVSS